MRTNTIQRRRTPLDVPWVRDELDLACSDTDLTSRKAKDDARPRWCEAEFEHLSMASRSFRTNASSN